jgi:hypothetical protein
MDVISKLVSYVMIAMAWMEKMMNNIIVQIPRTKNLGTRG